LKQKVYEYLKDERMTLELDGVSRSCSTAWSWLGVAWLVTMATMGNPACRSERSSNTRSSAPSTVSAVSGHLAKVKSQAKEAAEQGIGLKSSNEETSGAGTDAVPMCERICRLSDPLRCRNGHECKKRCESMAGSPVCSLQVLDLFKCLSRQPTKNWECDEDGFGAIRDPYCDKEQSKLVTCIQSNSIR
jgi:hypothetical protein